MAHHEAATHRTADDEYVAVPGSSYEHTDANVRAIVMFGFWLIVTALIVHIGIGVMYKMLIDQSKETDPRYPLATSSDPNLPPEPRLQQFPANEIDEFRMHESRELQEYSWIDKDAGVVRIPIADAMRLTLQRGLPARAEDPEHPATPPGMLASDASAGRVMERRRQ
jgi:hypothetical protein